MKAETRELHDNALELLDDEDSRTWMDADPSVAWTDPTSMHGRLGTLLEDAGWERCWHRHGALFHYNVKLRGRDAYTATRQAIEEYTDDREDASRIDNELESYVQQLHDAEMEGWWTWQLPETMREITEAMDTPEVYSCGRQAGYVNVPGMRNRAYLVPDLIELSDFLSASVEYYNSAEYGQWLAQEAIDRRAEDKMQELASDRIERIEA